MIAQKGMLMEMDGGHRLIVDDIKEIDDQEYVVFYALDNQRFYIATEYMDEDKPAYRFLSGVEAKKVAEAIDEIDHASEK